MAIRRSVFTLMRLLRPLVSVGSLVLILVCAILLLFSLTFPRGTHFPSVLVAGIALSCAAINVAYGYLMFLILPPGPITPAARHYG